MLKSNNNNSLHLGGGGHKPHYDSVSKLANPFKKAFTLAEIMITIGIIGVVAAITIPLLMQNSNSKKFTTQFKKSLSTLNQAAIGAQAQYDLDYSLLTQINDDATCKSDTLAGGQYTFCGLFNNTLAGHTYIGKYGNVKGANALSPYSADVTSFSIENFLFFSFADGAIVAFNPNAKSCGIGVGQTLTNEKLTSNLANCIGFIDVNGPTPPNKEVQCAEGATIISANTTCKVTNGSMGDIFPVVFHDGAVEPATNASLAAFLGGNGKESSSNDSSSSGSTGPRTVNIDGVEYKLSSQGTWLKSDGSGNLEREGWGQILNKTTDGYEWVDQNGSIHKYNNDMKELGMTYRDGKWYDCKQSTELGNGTFVREDSSGNLVDISGNTYTKTADGYERTIGSETYKYDNDLNKISLFSRGNLYEYKSGDPNNAYRDDGNGNLVNPGGGTYTKTSEGYEISFSWGDTYKYDNNMKQVGYIKNGQLYERIGNGNQFARDAGNGNLVDPWGTIYTKRSDGLYEVSMPWETSIYDENLRPIAHQWNW